MPDPYETLQVSRKAEAEVIAAAYRSLARKYHPDTNSAPGSSERMREINAAYEILRDPARRRIWDREHPASPGRILWRNEDAIDWSAAADPEDYTAWASSYARRRANPQPIPRPGFLERNIGCVGFMVMAAVIGSYFLLVLFR